jgi:hypothetical protein
MSSAPGAPLLRRTCASAFRTLSRSTMASIDGPMAAGLSVIFAEAVNIIERLIDQGPAMRIRSRRIAAHQHDPGRGDADDQRLGQHRRQRRLPRDSRPLLGSRRYRWICGPAQRERSARVCARSRLCLSHQGDRRLAHRERRHPLRSRRHRVVDHRHPNHRPGSRDHLSADPRRPARHPERAHPAGAG